MNATTIEEDNIMSIDPQFPVDEMASRSLEDHITNRLEFERAAYEREWERHEQLSKLFMASDRKMSKLIESSTAAVSERLCIDSRLAQKFARLRDADSSAAGNELARHPLGHHALAGLENQLTFLSQGVALGDRFVLRVPPYDLDWRFFKPDGALGTAARGPDVYKKHGTMFIDLVETYVDRPVAYGGWMRAGAGVGIWFKPKAKNTYVRVSPLVDYDYWWRNDSNLQVARNFGELGTRVLRHRGPDDFEILIDRRERLWSDGTGWFETHEGSDAGFWVNHDYFWGSSNDWYLIWVWCNGGIDFATKTTFGSSTARQLWKARVHWFVFEQWV